MSDATPMEVVAEAPVLPKEAPPSISPTPSSKPDNGDQSDSDSALKVHKKKPVKRILDPEDDDLGNPSVPTPEAPKKAPLSTDKKPAAGTSTPKTKDTPKATDDQPLSVLKQKMKDGSEKKSTPVKKSSSSYYSDEEDDGKESKANPAKDKSSANGSNKDQSKTDPKQNKEQKKQAPSSSSSAPGATKVRDKDDDPLKSKTKIDPDDVPLAKKSKPDTPKDKTKVLPVYYEFFVITFRYALFV